MLDEVEAQYRRHHHRLGRQRRERPLDAVDGRGVERDLRPEIRFGQNHHPCHQRAPEVLWARSTSSPALTRACNAMSILRPLSSRTVGPWQRSLPASRSAELTSELKSLMRLSYAVFCLTKKNTNNRH